MHTNQAISWEDAQTLLAVTEHQSFSGAAKALNLGQPTISRRIRKLEQQLNVQLFVRNKRGAVPTEVASKLIPAAEQMARWAGEFNRTIMGTNQGVSGTVRIAAPPGVAVEQLAAFAALMLEKEPEIRLEVLSSVEHLDLSRGDADLAIRSNPPTNPELTALHRAVTRIGVFGARTYVDNISQPCTWSDLDWVTWANPYNHVAPRPMLERLIANFDPIFTSDDYLVQKAAVRAGLGVMIMDYPPPNAEQVNALVAVDIGVNLPDSEFYIVCAKSLQFVPRVAAVAKLMVKHLDKGSTTAVC